MDMRRIKLTIGGKVWLYLGKAGWHFITINQKDSAEIKKEYIWPRGGFGSIPVLVTIGKISWKTSIFPDKDSFLLPSKKEARDSEGFKAGDTSTVNIEVIT